MNLTKIILTQKATHASNPAFRRLRQEDHVSKARLGYIVRP
jgi:hypothetical protein